MSSIIKSQLTNDFSKKEKTIQIKPFSSVHLMDQEQYVAEDEKHKAEKLVEEAQSKAAEIEEQAQAILLQARRQIELERQQWEEEKEVMAQYAKQQGYEEGFQQGQQNGLKTYEMLLGEAKQMIELTKQDYYSYMESSEEVMLHLGFEIAEKIIGQHLEQDRELFLPLIRTAIKEVREHKEIHLFVSAAYYPVVHERKEELLSLLNGETSLFIYPNEELAETACIIESSFGRIDASIDSQLNELKKKLLQLLKEDDSHES